MTLEGMRVVDFSCGIAGPYCTKLLADAGADVVTVEPPGGHASRRDGPPGLFDYLHTSKASVSSSYAATLMSSANVIVASNGFDVGEARRNCPWQVVTTITPFGSTGPWAGRPATEFTLQAACGSTGARGLPGEEPLSAGGRLGEWLTGVTAAVATLAAWLESERSGLGDHVDVALLDCMAFGMLTFQTVFADFAATCGKPAGLETKRSIEVPSIEPTAEGWVTFTTNSAQQFDDFSLLIGRPELAEDERFRRFGPRFEHRSEFWAMTRAYTLPRTSAEVLAEASLLRIPVAPVLDGSSIERFEQFDARSVFVDHPSGRFRQPRVPYLLSGCSLRPFRSVPSAGQDDERIVWRSDPARGTASAWRLPLSGVRVLDLTAWWAGPCATQVLGSLGADVIKVESTKRPDLMRYSTVRDVSDPQWWEWGPLAHATNTNKRGITIDLTRGEGRALFLRLVETADLLVENYTPRVMDQFDLGWEVLHERNPRLNMIRMPAFGLNGPWRDRTGFAQTMESLTGMAWITGFPDGPPTLVRGAGDPIAGLHAAFSAMVALRQRDVSGEGHLVEATMVEAVLNVAAPQPIAYQLTGKLMQRRGNRSLSGDAPQGVYRCQGDDAWLALAVENDDQWQRFLEVLVPVARGSGPHLPADAATMSSSQRQEREDEIDAWITDISLLWQPGELAERLTSAGIPAAEVIAPTEVKANPQIRFRRLFETEHHPVTGDHEMPGLPIAMSRVRSWLQAPAPTLGQHNDEVFSEMGLDQSERARLRDLGLIGDTPDGLSR